MATYIVGDLQGCLDPLLKLLDKVKFNPQQDCLWLAGDLVARGPQSLETLRFIKDLGESAVVILGNHDLNLIATKLNIVKVKEKDKTAPILKAHDCDELIDWLRKKPLLKEHPQYNFVMVHAGIYPLWGLNKAKKYAAEIHSIMQSDNYKWLFENMYGNKPTKWDLELTLIDRYKFIINSFTRMRFCKLDGELEMHCKLAPSKNNDKNLVPWFALPNRKEIDKTIIFGHWAALMGYNKNNLIGLDTGCVWGNHLTMLRWEDKTFFTSKR